MSANPTTATSSSLLALCGRKHKAKMGANLNESVATGPNDFARRQLEKLGWKEGTGLGKNRDGRSEHIRVTKRQDGQALGAASLDIDPVVTGDQWWKSSVGNTLARLAAANKKDKKSKKSKKSKKESKSKKRKIEYTDEELFAATGGARFGMRAQTQQRGKWNRAETAITKDQEDTAMAKTEWDGMTAPKVVLQSSSSEPKGRSKPQHSKNHTDANESDESEDSSKPPKRKKRKVASDDKADKTDEAKEKTKKPKKEKKQKKEKKEKKSKKEKKKKKSGVV